MAEATPAGIKETVIQNGLNTLRHLVLTSAGLVVTEAGTGGPVGPANCAPARPPRARNIAVPHRDDGSHRHDLVPRPDHPGPVNLPSVNEESIQEVTGPSAIAYGHGQEAVTIDDFLVNKDGSHGLLPKPFASVFGTLLLKSAGGPGWSTSPPSRPPIRSLPFQPRHFPRRGAVRLYPYDVVAYRGGWVVADAGANDLLYVTTTGRVSLLARFPAVAEQLPAGVIGNPTPITIDAQPVPTSVAVGPDGALYVGLLRGVPSDPGTADIYRVVPGHEPAIWPAASRRSRPSPSTARQAPGHRVQPGGLLAPPIVPGPVI